MRKIVGMTTWAALATAVLVNAAPEPVVDVAELVDGADVIVVGTVTDIGDTGRTPVDVPPDTTPGYVMFANVEIANVLKGPSTLTSVRFHFVTPEAVSQYRGIAVGAVRVFFLAARGDGYEPVSRYYPSLPALPGPTSGATPFARVLAAVSRPLLMADASTRVKHEVIQTLWFVPGASVPNLRPALNDRDESVRLAATVALLYNDDVTVLPVAEGLLLDSSSPISPDARQRLGAAIENGIKDPAAVPALRRLLQRGDAATRRAASAALSRTGSAAALPALVRGLGDDDPEVRINSVRGLARVSGQAERLPSWDAFKDDEASHVNFWKAWARDRGIQSQ